MNEKTKKTNRSGLSWTGVEPIDGYGQTSRVSEHIPKRDRYGQQSLNPYLLASPQAKGFDRFGLDCLAFRHFDRPLGNTQDSMARGFEESCQFIDRHLANCRIEYEELRMFLVLFIPVLLWGVLFGWMGALEWNPLWTRGAAALFPLFVGWRLHLSLSADLDASIPVHALYATTFLTRNGLTREDIKHKPELIIEGVRISDQIRQVIKYQICANINNYRGVFSDRLPRTEKFQIPSFGGASKNLYWGEWITFYNGSIFSRNAGEFAAHMPSLAALGGAAYAAGLGEIPDISYAQEIPAFDVPDVPESSSFPYSGGVDASGFPQFNTDGTLMIENSGIDISGHTYGAPHQDP